jgi:hypothetical protein
LIEANKMILKLSPIFRDNFSESIIHKTIPLIREIRFAPEDVVYREGECEDSSIYFI